MTEQPHSGDEIAPADRAELAQGDQHDLVSQLGQMTDAEFQRHYQIMERGVERRFAVIKLAMKACEPKDFVDIGGKPWLQAIGARRCQLVTGIKVGRPVFETRVVGDDVFVECLLDGSWPAFGIDAIQIGSCDTRDKFYLGDLDDEEGRSTYQQCLKRAGGDRDTAIQMLVASVKKKAYANTFSRLVSDLMGVRGLSWDSLSHLGFTPDMAAASVAFDGGKGSSASDRRPARRGPER
ncbi:MAG: hypothetical protein GF341_04740, partial [candidate division Zixibacteria bacterium]|nr:hypothetical protein [candidate division Zixibacteria bacterium]